MTSQCCNESPTEDSQWCNDCILCPRISLWHTLLSFVSRILSLLMSWCQHLWSGGRQGLSGSSYTQLPPAPLWDCVCVHVGRETAMIETPSHPYNISLTNTPLHHPHQYTSSAPSSSHTHTHTPGMLYNAGESTSILGELWAPPSPNPKFAFQFWVCVS